MGFGAKKHFATYDIIEKAPGWIGFISTAIGILGLVIDVLSTKFVSAIFVIIGIIGMYISFYDHEKNNYERAGRRLTRIFNELRILYFDVKSLPNNADVTIYQNKLEEIETRYYQICISKQILFSNWYGFVAYTFKS